MKYLVFSALEYTISLSAKQKNLRKQSDLETHPTDICYNETMRCWLYSTDFWKCVTPVRMDWMNGWIQWCRRTTVFERLRWNSSDRARGMPWAAATTIISFSTSRKASSGSSKKGKRSSREKLQYQFKYTQAKCLQGKNMYVAQLPRSCWKDRIRPPCSSLLSVHFSSDSPNISLTLSGRGSRGVKSADLPVLLLTYPWSKGSLLLFR